MTARRSCSTRSGTGTERVTGTAPVRGWILPVPHARSPARRWRSTSSITGAMLAGPATPQVGASACRRSRSRSACALCSPTRSSGALPPTGRAPWTSAERGAEQASPAAAMSSWSVTQRNGHRRAPLARRRFLADDRCSPRKALACIATETNMRRPSVTPLTRGAPAIAALALALTAPAADAALPDGAKAPDINTLASLAGKEFKFSLADALKKGPVVLYFYPAAFTPVCTVEAHQFAEATAKFKELGATVIGVSHDPIEKLDRFSVSECRNKFAVASDADGGIMKAYDSVLPDHPEYANRTSYVVAPTGEIIYSYTAMKPDQHVENTMAAVRKWQEAHNKKT